MDFSTIAMLAGELYARRDKLHYLFERRTIHASEFEHALKDINDAVDFIFNLKSDLNFAYRDDVENCLESEIASAESQLSARESDRDSLFSELQNIESEISYVEGEISSLESEIQRVESSQDDD